MILLLGAPGSVRAQRGDPEAASVEAAAADAAEIERLLTRGQYDAGISLAKRAVAISEKSFGVEDPSVGYTLTVLAVAYERAGDIESAELAYERALGILEKATGPASPDVALVLGGIARVNCAKGDYERAEALHLRSLAILEALQGPGRSVLATSINDLATLYEARGDYARAEPMYLRALAIRESARGPDHPDAAAALGNLAGLYRAKGDYVRAEPLYKRAIAISVKALGHDHPEVAKVLNNLAGVYTATGNHAQAERLYMESLAIMEHVFGLDHPLVATALNNIAVMYHARRDFASAVPFYERALAMREKRLGPEHPLIAQTLGNLAWLHTCMRDYVRAEQLFAKARAIEEKSLTPEHPTRAAAKHHLAMLYWAKGDTRSALRELERAADIHDKNAARELAVGADEQRRAYMEQLRPGTHANVSMHVQSAPDERDAKRLALRTILRRKGSVIDAMANSLAGLYDRRPPEDRASIGEWRALNAQYSALARRGPGTMPIEKHRDALQMLDDQRQKIESELSSRRAGIVAQMKPVTIEDVQSAIPEGAALVELFQYLPVEIEQFSLEDAGAARYVAYVLRRKGEVEYVDLGEARPIHEAVAAFLPTLRREAADPKPAGRKLDALVMQPIRRLLGDARQVFLSPDALLNLVPFAALVDEHEHYLIERYSFTYLTSGRDLVRMQSSAPPRQDAIIVAAPEYGLDLASTERGAASQHADARSADRASRSFGPLPFALEEAKAVHAQLENVWVLSGPRATERALMSARGPWILHIVTHGFFHEDERAGEAQVPDSLGLSSPGEFAAPLRGAKDPLLRSGLALAGANQSSSTTEDGILTALEASSLDLHGTKLVVLSACETGVGVASSGDGVYGLRRAFAIAGAETQVMSLWKVDDKSTRELMEAYYEGLLDRGGRSEVMRQAQLALLRGSEHAHPYHWASFIVSGNPEPVGDAPKVEVSMFHEGGLAPWFKEFLAKSWHELTLAALLFAWLVRDMVRSLRKSSWARRMANARTPDRPAKKTRIWGPSRSPDEEG